MPRRRARFLGVVLLSLVSVALPAPAQEQQPNVVPPVRQRIGPPPPDASPAALEDTGDQLRIEKAYPDALDYYRAALKKSSTAALYNKVGISELQMQRYKEAEKDFQKAVKIDRQYADAYNNLGVIYYIAKKYNRAVKQYRKALSVREESAPFHSNLGMAYFAQKKLDEAMKEYIRAMQIDPEVFERKSHAGIAAQMSSPEDRAHYSYVLAKMYAQAGNLDRALLYLRKAMEDGYPKIDQVFKDQEFAALRKDHRFTELMAARPAAIPQ